MIDQIIEFFGQQANIIATITLILGVLTAVKQFLRKIEEDVPDWMATVIKVLRKILEFLSANDGQSDDK